MSHMHPAAETNDAQILPPRGGRSPKQELSLTPPPPPRSLSTRGLGQGCTATGEETWVKQPWGGSDLQVGGPSLQGVGGGGLTERRGGAWELRSPSRGLPGPPPCRSRPLQACSLPLSWRGCVGGGLRVVGGGKEARCSSVLHGGVRGCRRWRVRAAEGAGSLRVIVAVQPRRGSATSAHAHYSGAHGGGGGRSTHPGKVGGVSFRRSERPRPPSFLSLSSFFNFPTKRIIFIYYIIHPP